MTAKPKLTMKERRFLAIIYPTGTIATGTDVGAKLYYRGFVTIAKRDRYGITPEGAAAIALYPEAFWNVGG